MDLRNVWLVAVLGVTISRLWESAEISGRKKRGVFRIAISNVGDLLISGEGDSALLSEQMRNASDVNFPRAGKRFIYLGIRITKTPIEFIEDGNIPDGKNTFAGLT